MLSAAKHLARSVLQGRRREILPFVQDDKAEVLSVFFQGSAISLTPMGSRPG